MQQSHKELPQQMQVGASLSWSLRWEMVIMKEMSCGEIYRQYWEFCIYLNVCVCAVCGRGLRRHDRYIFTPTSRGNPAQAKATSTWAGSHWETSGDDCAIWVIGSMGESLRTHLQQDDRRTRLTPSVCGITQSSEGKNGSLPTG